MSLSCVIVILLTSLLAIPFSYVLNVVSQSKDQKLILFTGAVGFLIVFLVPQYVLRVKIKPPRPKMNPFINVLSILTFNSLTSLIAALENDGLIAEFFGSFLRDGEPYLKSAHGTMMGYWDGVGHNAMYLTMMAAISWNQSFDDVGLFWVGSFGHRLLIVSLTVMIGKSIHLVVLLSVPLIFICIWSATIFMQGKAEEADVTRKEVLKDNADLVKFYNNTFTSIWKRPVDLMFVCFYVLTSMFVVFRFIAAIGGNSELGKKYVAKIEPYLDDTVKFSKSEIMIQMFYYVPYYMMSVFALLQPGQKWVPQWAIIYAGAAGHGQFAYMGSSFHYRTPYIHRVPQNWLARLSFWIINGLLFVMPQIMAVKYNSYPNYFILDPKKKCVENGGASIPSCKEKHKSLKTD